MPETHASKMRTRLEIQDRREKVAKRYRAGQSIPKIAEALGVSRVTAFRDVQAIMQSGQKYAIRDAGALLWRELEALAELRTQWWADALKRDAVATDKVLKIMERQHKLMGIEAPAKVDVLLRDEMRRLLEHLEASLPADVYSQVSLAILSEKPDVRLN
jgi:transposase